MAGLTATGFEKKRLADIVEETEEDFRAAFGAGFDLDANTPEGQIKGILDERISKLWELGAALSGIASPSKAIGAQVDSILALTGSRRQGATSSVVLSGRGRGVFGTAIPAGTIVSVVGNATSRFLTDSAAVISVAGINEVQTIAFDATPTSGDFQLEIFGETTANIQWNDSAATIQGLLEALPSVGVGNVVVSGTIDDTTGLTVTFQGTLAAQDVDDVLAVVDNNLLETATPVVITPAVSVEGDLPKTPLLSLTEESPRPDGQDPAVAPAGSLTVIETPVSGLTEFTNEEDAVVGTLVETDAEAKARRINEIQIAGAATINAIISDLNAVDAVTAVIVFQNPNAVTDLDGRPPHSIEAIVQGGVEADIAEAIFNTVAAGIGMVGSISVDVTDSEGFTHTVRFNRPTDINIWVEVDITKDINFYPTDGDDQVAAAILAYGEALEIGEDVVVFGSDPSLSCSFGSIPGITDYVIRVGKTVSPTLDDNIVLAPEEIADFDSGRITVTS